MKKPHFEILSGKDGKTYFHLKAANGDVILAGRGYKAKSETIHAIASVLRYGELDSSFVRRESQSQIGQFFFQLKTPSGRILGWSEMHTSKTHLDHTISVVMQSVKTANIKDLD